jgi:hypothetical protein
VRWLPYRTLVCLIIVAVVWPVTANVAVAENAGKLGHCGGKSETAATRICVTVL